MACILFDFSNLNKVNNLEMKLDGFLIITSICIFCGFLLVHPFQVSYLRGRLFFISYRAASLLAGFI